MLLLIPAQHFSNDERTSSEKLLAVGFLAKFQLVLGYGVVDHAPYTLPQPRSNTPKHT